MGEWAWRTNDEPGDGPDALFDERTIFEQRCRQPGTRCNWIMTMIERGLEDKEIAQRVRQVTKMECDKKTIAVYRKALQGKLCDMRTGRGNQSALGSAVLQSYMQVGPLYFNEGMSRDGISKLLGIKRKTVDAGIDKYRKVYGARRVKGAARYMRQEGKKDERDHETGADAGD